MLLFALGICGITGVAFGLTPLLEGRLFDDRDGAGAPPTAVIHQTMARTFWGTQSAIGRRVRPYGSDWCTIIGVVADAKNHGLDKPTGTELYLALGQNAARSVRELHLAMRTGGSGAGVMNSVRREVRELDPTLPLARVRTMAAAGTFVGVAVAGYIPARRATRVDPMVALRCE